MIHVKASLDGVFVVVATAALLSAHHEALHKLVFGHFKTHNGIYCHAAVGKQLFQCLGLCYGARKTVENHAFGGSFLVVVEHRGKNVNHELVGNQVTFVDV